MNDKESGELSGKCQSPDDNGTEEKKKKRKLAEDSVELGKDDSVDPMDDTPTNDKKRKKKKDRKGELSEGTVGNDSENKVKNDRTSKKKDKNHGSNSKASTPKKQGSRVRFSGVDEVFPFESDNGRCEEDSEIVLVQGKRFSTEEDNEVLEAVESYIKVLAYLIGPTKAYIYRAHVLLERSEKRKWDPEELEALRLFQKQHGSQWKTIAAELGKHRVHVKDAWRRIKPPNLKKGSWPQEEYQTLFDLVNFDLRLKAFEKKQTTHGMLRDNIAWEAISEKMSTRRQNSCCIKWYDQLSSPMVGAGVWADTDDYRFVEAIQSLDASCIEDVDWDNLLEHRSGEACRKRWTGDGFCVLCLDEAETVDHLFLNCRLTTSILQASHLNLINLSTPLTVASVWSHFCQRCVSFRAKDLSGLASVWWTIWLERNRRIFVKRETTTGDIFREARDCRSRPRCLLLLSSSFSL